MSKEIISEGLGYGLTIIAVGIVGIGGGVQQSSYYGLAAQLPPRYTQAIMAGESVAGLLACFNRIVTKAASGDTVDGLRTSTYAFFILSMFILIICMFVYSYIRKLPYTQYYLNHNNQVNQNNQNSLSLNGSDYRDREKNNENENENEKEKDALRRNEQQEYEIPMQTLHSDENGGENDNSLLENGEDSIQSTNSLSSNGFFQSILVSIWPKDRADTLKRIWKAALTTFLTFFVTLAIFPGVDTVPKFDSIGDWFPVLIITTFNFFDFIGKIVSAYHFNLTLNKQLLFATLRLIFVPLLILCATPRGNPFLSSLAWPIIFNVFFGFSNGYIGSVSSKQKDHFFLFGLSYYFIYIFPNT